MKESDLAIPFLEHFRDAEVFKEVKTPSGGIVDFVAKYGKILTSVEVKNSCSIAVMEQAYRNLCYFHYNYIAVPVRITPFQKLICNKFGIGILQLRHNRIEEPVKPSFRRKVLPVVLADYHKLSVAGSVCDRETAFSNSVKQIKLILAKKNGMSLQELFTKTAHYHWASLYSARNCFCKYVKKRIITGIEIIDGKVFLKIGG